jgi:hypothetical protein
MWNIIYDEILLKYQKFLKSQNENHNLFHICSRWYNIATYLVSSGHLFVVFGHEAFPIGKHAQPLLFTS